MTKSAKKIDLKIGKFGFMKIFMMFFFLVNAGMIYGQIFDGFQGGNVEPKIEVQMKYDEGYILFNFELDDNHHITDIKNGFFNFEIEKNDFLETGKVKFPKGVPYKDETVYKGIFSVKVYPKMKRELSQSIELKIKVSYQICQEHPKEVCFPPDEKEISITVEEEFKEVQIEEINEDSPSSLKDLSAASTTESLKPKGGNWLHLILGALIILCIGFMLGLKGFTGDDESLGQKFIRAIVILFILAGGYLFFKALDIKYFPENYSQQSVQKAKLNWIYNLEEGKTLAEKDNKMIMIDTYADWCVACKELDEYTFSDPDVAKVLDDYIVVKLDFTSNSEENKELQKQLKIIGLPTVIFLDSKGNEIKRFSGYLSKGKFLDFLETGESWLDKLVSRLKRELDKQSILLFLLVFLLGFLTSLTPCVYPVIPIIMGYIGTRSGQKKFKGFYLSIFFVLGLAFVYSLLGVIAAMAGTMIGVTFQNPIVVIVISAIFIIMGLSLAGLFEIPVPSSISSKVQAGGNKSEIFSSLLVGGVAGIIAAPCAGPVLITLLSWISQTKNIFLGFLLTFIFSLGMGIIFLLVGTFSGVISALPKGGKWMDYIKYFFAVILIAGGIFILNSIIPTWVYLLLWGVFLITLAIFSGIFKNLHPLNIKQKVYRFIVILIFLTGIFLFYKSLELKFFIVKNPVVASKTELL